MPIITGIFKRLKKRSDKAHPDGLHVFMRALGLSHGKIRIVAFVNSSSFHSLLTSREIFQEVSETMAFIISGDKCRHWEIGGIPLARYPGPSSVTARQFSSRPEDGVGAGNSRARSPMPPREFDPGPYSPTVLPVPGARIAARYNDQDALNLKTYCSADAALQIVDHDVIIIDDSESESESESFAAWHIRVMTSESLFGPSGIRKYDFKLNNAVRKSIPFNTGLTQEPS